MAKAVLPTTTQSGSINPLQQPEAYDTIKIGGMPAPGIGKLSRAKRKSAWDIKHGKGAQGWTLTYVGFEPVEFTYSLRLWRVPDWAAWDAFLPLLKYDTTKAEIAAIKIEHPILSRLNITSVVTKSVSQEEMVSTGLYQIDIEFIEYRPPPKVNATDTVDKNFVGPKQDPNNRGTPNVIIDSNQGFKDQAAHLFNQAGQPNLFNP